MKGGKSSRSRGHNFERRVVSLLRALGYESSRNLEYQPERAGHDVEYERDGVTIRVSCKYGSSVPLTAYGHAIMSGSPLTSEVDGERIMTCRFVAGHAWLRQSIGDCDELWVRHPGWPILRVIGPAQRLR